MRVSFMLGLKNLLEKKVGLFTLSVQGSSSENPPPFLREWLPYCHPCSSSHLPFPSITFRLLGFSALSPLCCSFMSTSLIVPPTLPCHIIPCSRDLTIERKKEGFSGVANETGKWKRRRRERKDQREREQMLVAKCGWGSHLGESLTEGSLTLVSKFL